MDVTIGVALSLLMATFVVVAVYYFRRQAKALEYMAEIEEARFMRQRQLWRREDASHIEVKPLDWLSEVASGALQEDVEVTSVVHVYQEPPALDAQAAGGGRIVYSPLAPRALKKTMRDGRADSKDPARRLTRMAADTPLLGANPRRVRYGERSLMDDEWFDVKAEKVGKETGVPWREPGRLWVYLIPAGS